MGEGEDIVCLEQEPEENHITGEKLWWEARRPSFTVEVLWWVARRTSIIGDPRSQQNEWKQDHQEDHGGRHRDHR